jgi:hypothetical protein
MRYERNFAIDSAERGDDWLLMQNKLNNFSSKSEERNRFFGKED